MAELKKRILVVDDDQRLRELVVRYLAEQGFDARAVPDAAGMDKQLSRERYDLVVLDLMLPGEDGLAICRRLRSMSTGPAIVMLTAKGDEVDRIVGLEMGADDYLPKPFSLRELTVRVHAILRRRERIEGSSEGEPIERLGLLVDAKRRRVEVDGAEVPLTPLEFEILYALVREPGVVLSRDQLMDRIWGYRDHAGGRVVDSHVARLRRKIGEDGNDPRFIRTVHGVGYAFKEH